MEPDQMTTGEPTVRPGFWLVVLGVALGAVLLSLWIKNAIPKPHSGLSAGAEAPVLQAVGWLNGEAPRPTPAPGTIRVMHAWFTTCPACSKEAPELVELHAEYKDQGVEFVGLTYESPARLRDIEKYLETTGITWVNGYGGLETLQQFEVEYFPSVWIIDSDGRILWNRASKLPLEQALPLALEGKRPKASPESS
jgi:thiol-disulfide isomerase/thioredoxin